MALKNKKAKTKWMNERMKKGYSFIYEKEKWNKQNDNLCGN